MINPYSIRVLTHLRDKKDGTKYYRIEKIIPQYWGDGALGFQLQRIDFNDLDVGAPFWVRPEELSMIYEEDK